MKILIIRFSSFGDIVQAMGVLAPIKKSFSDARIDWVCRQDMQTFLEGQSHISKLWIFDRKLGLKGLWSLSRELSLENYTHLYDAHSSLRSLWLRFFLWLLGFRGKVIVRSKERWRRFLLFKLRKNTFENPYKGVNSYLAPLKQWNINGDAVQLKFQGWGQIQVDRLNEKICLVPSAAWEMKRWPLEYWKELIVLLPNEEFVVLGGPEDHFCEELVSVDPSRVVNLAGKLNFKESALVVQGSKLCISADTGLLHIADHTGTPAIALIGPTAFGFPYFSQTEVMGVDLPCRPCTKDGRGKCSQSIYKRCLIEITPASVSLKAQQILSKLLS
jgi:heptosyltransferase-2